MIVVLIVLLVLVTGLAVAAVMGRFGAGSMADAVGTTPFEALPDGPVDSGDVAALRFDQTMRGYRMGQVDDVLDRLRSELDERDAEIARLRAERDDLIGR